MGQYETSDQITLRLIKQHLTNEIARLEAANCYDITVLQGKLSGFKHALYALEQFTQTGLDCAVRPILRKV